MYGAPTLHHYPAPLTTNYGFTSPLQRCGVYGGAPAGAYPPDWGFGIAAAAAAGISQSNTAALFSREPLDYLNSCAVTPDNDRGAAPTQRPYPTLPPSVYTPADYGPHATECPSRKATAAPHATSADTSLTADKSPGKYCHCKKRRAASFMHIIHFLRYLI